MSINFGVFIVNQTPQNFRARFHAISSLSFAVGSIIGTALVGYYIDRYNVYTVWYLIAGLSTIGTLGMLYVRTLVLKGERLKKQS
jgi:MFS family permease